MEKSESLESKETTSGFIEVEAPRQHQYGHAKRRSLRALLWLPLIFGLYYSYLLFQSSNLLRHQRCSGALSIEQRAHKILSENPLIGRSCAHLPYPSTGADSDQMVTMIYSSFCEFSIRTGSTAKSSRENLKRAGLNNMSTSPGWIRESRAVHFGALSCRVRRVMGRTFRTVIMMEVRYTSFTVLHRLILPQFGNS